MTRSANHRSFDGIMGRRSLQSEFCNTIGCEADAIMTGLDFRFWSNADFRGVPHL